MVRDLINLLLGRNYAGVSTVRVDWIVPIGVYREESIKAVIE
ncbi:hypothetical protein QA584_06640 [Anaerocolumna sp. AGMB13025]|nr:hypothetical protein [Anaerocolumna sp. AGMB13025]WFR58750.1 hypothetical protein QA584_06640 [Anaerocolumna sp. AGMB13025]